VARKAKAAAEPKEPVEKKPAAKAKAKAKAKEKAKPAARKALPEAPKLESVEAELAEARRKLEELAQQQEATLARTHELAEKAAARAEEMESLRDELAEAREAALLAEQAQTAQGPSAEEFDLLKAQLAEAHTRLVASTQLEWKLEVAQAKAEDLEADLQQAQARVAELEAQAADTPSAEGEAELQTVRESFGLLQSVHEELETRVSVLQETNLELTARNDQLQDLLAGLRARLAELEAQLASEESPGDRSAHEDAELQARLTELETSLAEAQARSAELESERARTAELDEQLRRFEADSRQAEERTRELERRLPQLESDLRAARSRSHELEDQLGTFRSRSLELEDELMTLRSRSQELEGEVQSLRSKERPNALLARVQGRETSKSDEQKAQLTRAEARAQELQAQLDATAARCKELEARVESGPRLEALQEELMQAHGRASVLEGLLTEATTQLEKSVTPELERQLRHALARADELEARLANQQPANPLAQVVKLGELETQLAQARAELDRALEVEAAATQRARELEAMLADAHIARVAPSTKAQPLEAAADAPMPGLLYEPIFELVSGRLVGVEATPCWDDPEHGLIRVPGDSLPVTTCYQLLIHVCQLAAAWRAEGFTFFTAMDTGSTLLHHPELPGILLEALRLGHLPPDMVMLDIPGLAHSEDGRLESVLGQLAHGGVGLAVEGLGTGTTSFAHLAMANLAKLDPRLVAALPQQPWAVQSAKAVLGLARGQGVRSCAVGVETEAQFRWLRNAQCELGQGSHLSPPVLPEQIVEFARWGRLYA